MAQFTVRDFDEGLYRSLKERAERHHRSLEAEVRDMLARMLNAGSLFLSEKERAARAERLQKIDAIRNSIDPSKVGDAVAYIREMRDSGDI